MAVNSQILGPDGKHVDSLESEGFKGLYTVSTPLKKFKNRSVFFTNPTYGSNMTYNFSIIDTRENVHDGNDNTYWTATTIEGGPSAFDFSSTDQAHTGNQSIACVKSGNGDVFQLEDEAELHSGGDYGRFVGWIYIDSNWVNNDTRVYFSLYNTNAGLQVSDKSINLDNYIDGSLIGEWIRFNIGMYEFGTITDDYNAIRVKIGESGSNPDFYLDDLELQDLGESTNEFSVEPPKGYWWHIDGIGIIIVSDYVGTLADSSMPNIPYNGLLGIPLVNGIQYRRQEEGKVEFSFTMNNLIEIINQYNAYISSSGYDGNYTWIKIDLHFREPFKLKSEFEDFISFTVGDDLSTLQYFRAVASIQEEERDISSGRYYTGSFR